MKKRTLSAVFLILSLSASLFAQEPPSFEEIAAKASLEKGKRPVILIPGILGSELVNRVSGEKVWFSLRRSKDDDLKLPIAASLSRNRDNLVPGDVLRSIRFLFATQDFYGDMVKSLTKYGQYTEASIESPPKDLTDKFFVFPYDWRRDNVETARLLVTKLAALRKASGQKNIKFDIVAHSMGGLVARYAAMYGNRDLPSRNPRPDWAGSVYFERIFMFGTPNEGSADSLQVLLEGFGAISGVNLPFVRDLSPLEVFTMPSVFQLLPRYGSTLFYDEDLKPIEVDIYDYRTWEKYRWSIYSEDAVFKTFTEAELARSEIYLEDVLERAKKFHTALSAPGKGPVKLFTFASDCVSTLDSYVLYKNKDGTKWQILTRPSGFTNSKGEKVSAKRVREIMLKAGDGRVPMRSVNSLSGQNTAYYVCEKHDSLLSNSILQRQLMSNLLAMESQNY